MQVYFNVNVYYKTAIYYSNAVMLIVYIFNSNGAGKTRDRMHL